MKTTKELRSCGEIKKTDARLWACESETGKETLMYWGDLGLAIIEMNMMAKRGMDVWVIDSDGTKITPIDHEENN